MTPIQSFVLTEVRRGLANFHAHRSKHWRLFRTRSVDADERAHHRKCLEQVAYAREWCPKCYRTRARLTRNAIIRRVVFS